MNILLENWTVIRISGRERFEYLDGLVPNDLTNEILNRSALLNPKAKIMVLFWIEVTDEHFLLFTPSSMRGKLIELLLKYKLSMDIKLEDIGDEMPSLYLVPDEKELAGLGRFRFTFSDTPLELQTYDDFSKSSDFLDPLQYLGRNPVEMGMADIIHLPKGCFLGQEPLARMLNLGRPRKLLHLVHGHLADSDLVEVLQERDGVVFAMIDTRVKDYDQFIAEHNLESIERYGNYPLFKRI